MVNFEYLIKENNVIESRSPKEAITILIKRCGGLKEIKKSIVSKKYRGKYINIPCAFDTETSSVLTGAGKCGIVYAWCFGFNGWLLRGRDVKEFYEYMYELACQLHLSKKRKLICYVHNLGFDFAFIHHYFQWEKVFLMRARVPLYALSSLYIEFRCSYLLSSCSLAKVGKDLKKYKVEKLVGELDYQVARFPHTPLTDTEWNYIYNDVKVVMAYIQEFIDDGEDLAHIPYTNTGFVRRYCTQECLGNNDFSAYKYYSDYTSTLLLTLPMYIDSNKAFAGGFTHGNPKHTGKTLRDVGSADFTSAYPYCCMLKLPMSTGEKIDIKTMDEFTRNNKLFYSIFTIEFTNINCTFMNDCYISSSKCTILDDASVVNGRVRKASKLRITITNIDFEIIEKIYEWDEIKIGDYYRFQKDYLPTPMVKAILTLYKTKTELKGCEEWGTEDDVKNYCNAKARLNSIYGNFVTAVIQSNCEYDCETHTFNDEEVVECGDANKIIERYNNDRKRVTYYLWGVFVTALCRQNLWSAILEFGNDYVYCDTDSIKGLNFDKHMKYFEDYNKQVRYNLQKAMKYHGLSMDYVEPMTRKGEKKLLGVWDMEGTYELFKNLGAKRYMYTKNGKLNITVSGLNKKVTVPYIENVCDNPYEFFTDGMYIPKGYTGKNTHTYIDEERIIHIDGIEYKIPSGIYMEESDYSLEINNEFIDYIEYLMTIGE